MSLFGPTRVKKMEVSSQLNKEQLRNLRDSRSIRSPDIQTQTQTQTHTHTHTAKKQMERTRVREMTLRSCEDVKDFAMAPETQEIPSSPE